ncbi:MAG: hypothetical protein ACOX5M_06975 [Bacillota bacterium]
MAESFRDTAFVMDSGSLLAYLRNDAGGALVQRVLRQCSDCETQVEIAAPVLLEAYSTAAAESPLSLEELVSIVDQLPIHVEPATHDRVIGVAQVIVEHPELSPVQAATLHLALDKGATLLTTDRTLANLSPSLYVSTARKEGDLPKTHEFHGS